MPTFRKSFEQQIPPDQTLANLGPVIQIQIQVPFLIQKALATAKQPIPTPVTGWALLDTGASICMIDQTVVQQLNLTPKTRRKMVGVTGAADCPAFLVRVLFPEIIISGTPAFFDPEIVTASPTLKELGITALLGRDLLRHMVLIYDGIRGSYTIAW